MRIEIINGTYTRDDEAVALLTSTEDEYIAAIAQKLVIRQERQRLEAEKELERQRKRAEKEQERERQKRMARNRLIDGSNSCL